MKRLKCFAAGLALLLLVCSLPLSAGLAEEQTDLSFNEEGTFTVLTIADAQDTQFTSVYLIRSLRGILRDYPVDLVVFLGGQLDGENPLLRLGREFENVKTAIANLTAPMREAGVPYAVVLGGSDHAAGVSVQGQMNLYRNGGECAVPADYEAGAYRLPVYSNDGQDVALNLYLFDSGADEADGQPGTLSEEQVKWYIAASEEQRLNNGNQAIPAVALMHAPLPEVYGLLGKAEEGAEGSFSGTGAGAGQAYQDDQKQVFLGEILEAPSTSGENSGLFDAFVGGDEVFLAVSGRNHLNSFIGSHRGVDLAGVPGSTFVGYGNHESRGVRLFRFSEGNVRDYETMLVPFSDYNQYSGLMALYYGLTTSSDGISALAKLAVVGGLLLMAIGVLIYLLMRKRPDTVEEDLEEQRPQEPEDPYL